MQLNTKVRYGLRTMMEIALQTDNKGILQKDISKNQNISEKYLDQIISSLKVKGLIMNTSGKKSGYILKKPSREISIYDIYKSFEPELSIVHCLENPSFCEISDCCSARELWEGLNSLNKNFLKKNTLEDLVKKHKKIKSKLKVK
jgi:Rrf2 family transcriptional regulator, iron-sulfur cluster assembly transcription factor